ncbi:MAG TPA: hypothetical protein VMY77_17255 [Chitinophagaceae bacterium]|nr:hypothetical protein [Chitinophagaceae bacterium]
MKKIIFGILASMLLTSSVYAGKGKRAVRKLKPKRIQQHVIKHNALQIV